MSSKDTELYIIHEHRKVSEECKSISDRFLKAFELYASKAEKQKLIGKFKERNILCYSKDIHNRGNNVGILEFGGTEKRYCLELRPKLDEKFDIEYFWNFLPKMLNTLCDFQDFERKIFIDPKEQITLPKGCSIVPLLTLSFVSLCDKVIQKGMLKKYLKKTERVNSIKGRIDFVNLIKRNSWDLSTVPCSYYDLTFDNPENQIVLWCAHRLLGELRKVRRDDNNIPTIKKLREQYYLMSSEISLLPKNEADFFSINLSGVSSYYTDLMSVCQAILTESLFSLDKSEKRKNKGVNFIIDMDWVFEQYMTHLFNEVAKERMYCNLAICSQSIKRLGDSGKIRIKPDLLIKDKNSKQTLSIIDFKWKVHENNINADFYQVICYGLAETQKNSIENIHTNLFSVSNQESERLLHDTITINDNHKKILIFKIPLNSLNFNEKDINQIEKNIMDSIRYYFNLIIKELCL